MATWKEQLLATGVYGSGGVWIPIASGGMGIGGLAGSGIEGAPSTHKQPAAEKQTATATRQHE